MKVDCCKEKSWVLAGEGESLDKSQLARMSHIRNGKKPNSDFIGFSLLSASWVMGDTPEFITLIDSEGFSYMSFNPVNITSNLVRPLNASVGINYGTFLSDTLELSRFATGRFSTDLTERDDLILAYPFRSPDSCH